MPVLDPVVAQRPLVSVVYDPGAGPRCTVQLPDGRIVFGFRVPDDHRRGLEVVYRGHPCRARWLDASSGSPTDSWDGQQLLGSSPGGGYELVKADAYRIEIESAEPPELPIISRLR